MRKPFLLSLLVALLTTLSLHAYDFKSGDLCYNITSDTTVEVTYQEYQSASNYQGLTTATIPATVTDNGTTYSVTSIGYRAFGSCSSLTSITLPNSVTSIGSIAFSGCSSLTSITFPNSVTSIEDGAFSDCSSLTSITLPNSITTIGELAFWNCSSLTSINIPNSVTSIGNHAFRGCSSLTSINIPNAVTSIGRYAFYCCYSLTSITIPNAVTSIERYAFYGCFSLTSINIPYSVTSIGDYAFDGCSSLTSITIPNSVTRIGNSAFSGCSSLTSITLPNAVTSIGERAFSGCSSLTSITIPNSVTSIGRYAFDGCSSLTSVVWNAKNCAGWEYLNDAPFFYICANITSFTFGEEVETIPSGLCYGMTSLTSITIPNSVTSIEEWAFSGCSSLTSITLPNSVTSIGWCAFAGCSSLTSIVVESGNTVYDSRDNCNAIIETASNTLIAGCQSTIIPNSVTSIGIGAFYNCSSLTSITIPNAVTSIGEYAFYGCTSLPVEDNLRYADTYLVEAVDKSLSTYTIKIGTKWIGSEAFWGCSSLTSVTLPNSVTSIGGSAFRGCSSLTSVTLGNSVTSIGDYAFSDCSSLTSIVLPNSVTSIGGSAFRGCSSLTSVTLGNSVISIGDGAFYGCSSLTKTNYTGDIASWCNIQFTNYTANPISFSKNLYLNDVLVTDLVIPQGVIGVGDYAFDNCSSLTSVTIPNSVKSIGVSAFYGCSSLTSITIPNSVTSIEKMAFNGCTSLRDITCLAVTPPVCGTDAFNMVPSDATLWCPCESLEAYQAADSWSRFNDIRRIDFPQITILTDTERGRAQIDDWICNPQVVIISATPYEGYVFTRWSDGDTDNPRTITLTQDTTFTAEFTPNQYTLTTTAADAERGTTQGDTIADYLSNIQVSAFANYGYHFFQWSDGNANNPRTIALTQDTTFTAVFAPNKYVLTTNSSDAERGTTQGDTIADYLSNLQVFATATLGYAFTQWSDGNTDNPRTIKLTQDTTLTAEFGLADSGKCGDDLYWAYSNQEIKITGSGSMYNYTDSTMPWTLLRDSILTVRVGNNATSIGEYAFANTRKLAELQIGTGVEDIGANAFAGCNRIYHIYCYPTYPPFADESSFANYNVYLHIPCENKEGYTLDLAWGKFKFIECIGSEDVEVSGNEVTVSPDYEDATFTWPVTDNADTYSLVITKDGVTFCTLVFNAQGQLVSIAFKPRRQNAPAAEGTTPATYAEMTANGFRFTVTGLNEGSAYAYTLTVRNAANTVLETYTGDFTTLSNTPTGINESAGEDAHGHGQVEKIIRDGQVLILRNGVTYDMMGQTL